MKPRFAHVPTTMMLFALCIFPSRNATACDACSSNMGAVNSTGLMDFDRSFLNFTTTLRTYGVYIPSGYRWMTSGSVFEHGSGHEHPRFEKSAFYEQAHFFHELRFSHTMKNVTLSGTLPFVQKKLTRNGELLENNTGLGDVRFGVLFRAVNSGNSRGTVNNRLYAGAGFSLPTGQSSAAGYDGMIEPSRQTGTGTFTAQFQAAYILNIRKFGLNAQVAFQTSDVNSRGYRFGNVFVCALRAFYELKAGKILLTPSAGMSLETAGNDKLNGKPYALETGGRRIWCPVGIDVFVKRVGMNFQYFLPASERLDGL